MHQARIIIATLTCSAATLAFAQTRDRSDGRGGPATSNAATNAATTAPARAAAGNVRAVPPANEYAERFAVIGNLNMFVRDRAPRPEASGGGGATRPAQPPASPESVLVLRGVVLEGGGFRAYFENLQASEIVQVTAGDALARGHVVEISIDAVAFEHRGAVVWVKVGDNLVGAQVAAGPTGGSAGATTAPAAGADPSTLSIEERMRQRRMQRGGGGAR